MQGRPQQTLSLKLKTPGPDWELDFISIHEGNDKFIAIAKLTPGSDSHETIGDCEAKISVDKKDLHAKPVQYFVLADKLGGWYLESNKFTAINNLDSIKPLIANMQEIYKSEEKKTHRRSLSSC